MPPGLPRTPAESPRHRALHESPPDDPARREVSPGFAVDGWVLFLGGLFVGIAAFIICADLVRQFEFAQNVWINDKTFHELGNEHDPICGTQDGTLNFTVPKRPIRKVHKGLPAFTTMKGGAYFFLPGIGAIRYLASLGD